MTSLSHISVERPVPEASLEYGALTGLAARPPGRAPSRDEECSYRIEKLTEASAAAQRMYSRTSAYKVPYYPGLVFIPSGMDAGLQLAALKDLGVTCRAYPEPGTWVVEHPDWRALERAGCYVLYFDAAGDLVAYNRTTRSDTGMRIGAGLTVFMEGGDLAHVLYIGALHSAEITRRQRAETEYERLLSLEDSADPAQVEAAWRILRRPARTNPARVASLFEEARSLVAAGQRVRRGHVSALLCAVEPAEEWHALIREAVID